MPYPGSSSLTEPVIDSLQPYGSGTPLPMTLGGYDPYAGISGESTVNLAEIRKLRIVKGDTGNQGPRGVQGPAGGPKGAFDTNKALVVAKVTAEQATAGTLYFSVELDSLAYKSTDGTIYMVHMTPVT